MTREEAIEMLKALNMMLRSPDGKPISDACDALDMAIEALQADTIKFDFNKYLPSVRNKINDGTPSANMKSWNGLYIKVYVDDDPQDKAEKLYQICDNNEALSEVAKCIQGYLDESSAKTELKWNCTANFVTEQLDRLRKMTDEEKLEFLKRFFGMEGDVE